MVSASVSTTPKAAKGDAPSDNTKTNAKSKGTAGSISSDQHNPDDGDLSIHVPRKVSGGTSISHHNLQLLVFVGILALLLQFGSKMGVIIQPPKDGTAYRRMLTSPVKRHQQRKEMFRNAIFNPLVKVVLRMNPDAFWASIVDGDNENYDDPCSLYLGPSSIPDTGWGWFAGKNYTAGESIRIERGHKHNFLAVIPPPPSATSSASSTSETPTTTTKGIVPWSLLLKPHSLLSNVKWEEEDDDSSSLLPQEEEWALAVSVLVATRDIVEGEEFFVSWEDHPNGGSGPFGYVFGDSLPSPDHFLRADEHIREARIQYFGTINYTKLENGEATKPRPKIQRANSDGRWNSRNKKRKASSQQQLYKTESARDIETGLTLWQRAVEKYDPLVAKLLPTKVRTLAMYHQRAALDELLFSSSSLLGSLRNQTVRSLAKDAWCVSSLEWQQQIAAKAESKDDDPNTTTEASKATTTSPEASKNQAASCAASGSHYHQVVTRMRGFAKGEIIGVLPLSILQQPSHDAQQEPSALSKAGNRTCLPIPSSSASPMTMAMTICPLGGIHERTRDPGLANVEYRWSKNSTIDGIETLQKHPLSLSWDIVALRDLQQNETVRLSLWL
jgi:hypothetical protein